jgi:hypothetical protein
MREGATGTYRERIELQFSSEKLELLVTVVDCS